MNPHLATAVLTSVVLLVLAVVSRIPTYRVAPVFLLPALWGVYWLRRRLHIHPFHYVLFGVALMLHNLGALGYYQSSPLGFSWDILVHYFFGLVGILLVHRAVRKSLPLSPWHAAAGAVLLVMGMGAIHELFEYSTYLLLGEEKGMLKPGTSYFFDTQRDLLNNLLGAVTGILGGFLAGRERGGLRIEH